MTQKLVNERIAMLRYLMIVGIVVLHAPPYVPITEIGPGAFEFFKAFFQSALFRATVPVLTVVSGYLLFRAGLDQHWRQLAKKKFRTIVVPFFVFNFAVLISAFAAQYLLGIRMNDRLVPFELKVWLDAAFGLTKSPINYPLSFLRDLIVLMALAPLFGIALRSRPWLGFIVVILIFFNNLDGLLVRRDLMPIMFYIGGLAATQKWNLQALDRFALPCLGIFLALCVCIVQFRIGNTSYFRYVSPFFIWPAAALLHDTRLGSWLQARSKTSFFIFLGHAPVLMVLSIAYQKLGSPVPYPIFWCAMPVIAVVVLSMLYSVFMPFCPFIFAPLIGAERPAKRSTSQSLNLPVQPLP